MLEKELRVELGPQRRAEHLHKNLSANVLLLKDRPNIVSNLITETGKLRRSLVLFRLRTANAGAVHTG